MAPRAASRAAPAGAVPREPFGMTAAKPKPVVGVVGGSRSDFPVLEKAIGVLAELAIPAELRVVRKVAVGDHPNQMALHKDGRLFVACASSNCVSVIDTKRGHVVETISTALFPRAPEGSTPDALALSPDGETLYVANADNNCVAVIDVESPRLFDADIDAHPVDARGRETADAVGARA